MEHRRRPTRACLSLLVGTVVAGLALAPAATAAPSARAAGAARALLAVGPPEAVRITRLGAVNLRSIAATSRRNPIHAETPAAREFRLRESEGAAAKAQPHAGLQPPTVPGLPVSVQEVQRGLEGLTHRDQAFASGIELEPPDQGLCGGTFQGTTFLWEETNLAIGLFDTQQSQYTPPALGVNVLYGVPPNDVLTFAAVVVVLLAGLWNMMRGTSPNLSQTLMRWRVVLQFLAIVIAMILVYFLRP